MAEPAPPDAANQGQGHPIVDRDVWLACAVPLSRLPALNSEVYYFPHGHAEQCPDHLPAPLPTPHLFPCTVTAVSLGADADTNEVFAKISLKPGPHRGPPADPEPQQQPAAATAYCAKELTQSDANNGGGFSVPRYCADHVFPRLNFEADPPVQNLAMRDPEGGRWQFRHIYRGTPRRHLLTTGWSKFVNANLLVAGDHVVFMRRPDGQLLIGLRLSPRYPFVEPDQPPPRNARARVPTEEVLEAARLAAEGTPFTVTYYPRLGAGEFVVPRKEVEDAIADCARWETGAHVRMQVMDAKEDTRRAVVEWANGTVKAIHQNIWRALEIDWDESSPSNSRFLNAWQVQFVGYPPLSKRPRILVDAAAAAVDGSSLPAPPPIGTESSAFLLGSSVPADMQGARHICPTAAPSPSPVTVVLPATQLLLPVPIGDLRVPQLASPSGVSSEILDPDAASPPSYSVNMPPPEAPAEVKTIQLFGTTITAHVAEHGVSKQVNLQGGVARENAEKDVQTLQLQSLKN